MFLFAAKVWRFLNCVVREILHDSFRHGMCKRRRYGICYLSMLIEVLHAACARTDRPAKKVVVRVAMYSHIFSRGEIAVFHRMEEYLAATQSVRLTGAFLNCSF